MRPRHASLSTVLTAARRGRTTASVVVAAGLAATVALVTTAGTAGAALPSGAVTVPRSTADWTRVNLETSSGSTVLMRQTLGYGDRYLTGATGTLSPVSLPDAVYDWVAVGSTLFGAAYDYVDGANVSRLLTYDLDTEATTDTDISPSMFVTAADAGWIGQDGETIQLHSGATTTDLMTGVDGARDFQVSGHYAIGVVSLLAGGGSTVLVDLSVPSVTELAAVAADRVAISGTNLAWLTGESTTLHRRAVAGGPVSTTALGMEVGSLTVIDGAVAFIEGDYTSDRYLHVDVLPNGGTVVKTSVVTTELRSAGTHVLAGVSGPMTQAGLWSVAADGTAARIAQVPTVKAPLLEVDVAAGAVWTSDEANTSAEGKQIWRRTVSGSSSLTLGARSLVLPRASSGSGFAVSAGRALLGVAQPGNGLGSGLFRFYDRGAARASGVFPHEQHPQLSGPYAYFGDALVRADGQVLLPPVADRGDGAVFGSRVLIGSITGRVQLLDVAAARSASNPSTLRAARCVANDYCSPTVALGGDTAAWVDDGTGLTVRNLRTGAVRTISESVSHLTADVGVLAWVSSSGATSQVRLLDTAAAGTPSPVTLVTTGGVLGLSLDDGLVAWTDGDGDAHVARLPFDHPRKPRLLGVLGTAFSPNGDGRGDTWKPQLDLTKPLSGNATLTIRKGTTVVRTLTGTAPDGSIRDIVWNGRDAAGAKVPDGVYRWTLTGTAADGDGAVVGLDGVSAASGAVAVDRTGAATTVSPAPTSATGGTTPRLKVAWATAADLAGNPPVSYDVRVRTVTPTSGGGVSYGSAVPWLTATSSTSGRYGTSLAAGSVHQFSARVRDSAGNLGPWSAWRSAAVSWDDRALTRTGTWTRPSDAAAYAGTLTTSSTAGARLTKSPAWGSRIVVVGTTCPTCGAVKVYVDGDLEATVDTRSTTTKAWQTLFSKVFPRARHDVALVVVGTFGRPKVMVDAVGYLLP